MANTTLALKTLEVARTQIGVAEDPPGSNRGDGVDKYEEFAHTYGGVLAEGQSWCVAALVWCVYHSGHELGVEPKLLKTVSSSALFRWCRDNGLLLKSPQPACIGFLKGGPTGHEHTFLVESVDAHAGIVHSIDGNWGNRVQRTHHAIAHCDFGQIT